MQAIMGIKIGTDKDFLSEEFSSLSSSVIDNRLYKRLISISTNLLSNRSSIINMSQKSNSDRKGAYRFFSNQRIEKSDILKSHIIKTEERCKAEKETIYMIQDTTTLNYTSNKSISEALGTVSKTSNKTEIKGLLLHSTLCVTASGRALGLIDQKIFTHTHNKTNRKHRKIEEKESFRWIESLHNANERLSECNDTIMLCDRESDIFEFFHESLLHDQKVIVRVKHNRTIGENHRKRSANLFDAVESEPAAGQHTIQAYNKKTHKYESRIITIKYGHFDFAQPHHSPISQEVKKDPIRYYVVYGVEEKPSNGNKPIRWALMTNIEIHNFQDACQIVDGYKLRWHIENYHKVLKSVFNIEYAQLEDVDRLEKLITLISILAYRVYLMVYVARVFPHKSCTTILEDHEWKTLYLLHKKTIPKNPPSSKDAITMIAQLGGFMARKNDGNPGIIILNRGWQRLSNAAEIFYAVQSMKSCG